MDSLSSKSYRSYDYISRYQQFPYYYHDLDGKYIYGTTSQMDTDVGYTLHTVKRGESFDSLALDYYNNPTLFWIICDFNKVQDPFTKLKEGDKIKIPVMSSIRFLQER